MPNQHPWFKHPISEVLPIYNDYYNQLERTTNKSKRVNIISDIQGFLNGSVVIDNIKKLKTYNYTVYTESPSRKFKNDTRGYRLIVSNRKNLEPTLLTEEEIAILKKFVDLLETEEAKKYEKVRIVKALIWYSILIIFFICFILYLNYSSK